MNARFKVAVCVFYTESTDCLLDKHMLHAEGIVRMIGLFIHRCSTRLRYLTVAVLISVFDCLTVYCYVLFVVCCFGHSLFGRRSEERDWM